MTSSQCLNFELGQSSGVLCTDDLTWLVSHSIISILPLFILTTFLAIILFRLLDSIVETLVHTTELIYLKIKNK